MKKLSFLLGILLLLQSCNAYEPPTSLESAVGTNKKARVVTTDKQRYVFNRLEYKNDQLIGYAKRGSSTANKLAGMPAKIEGDFRAFDLSSVEIKKVRLRNKPSSIALTVVTIISSLLVAFFTVFAISFSNTEIFEGEGSE